MTFALVQSGCERSVPRTDYFPLRDGNRWEYRLLDMPLLNRLEAGQTIATAPLDDGIAPVANPDADLAPKAEVILPESEGAAKPKGETAPRGTAPVAARRVFLELRDSIDEITFKALYDTAEQVWSKRNGYVGFQSARGRSYLLILPPHTGYRWVVTAPGGQDVFFEIESAGASLNTPAGNFNNCVTARQESRDRTETFRYWFAPNVGLVRRSKYYLKEEVFRQELVEYTVKPATPATRMAEDREVRRAVEGGNRGSEFRQRRAADQIELPDPDRINDKVRRYADPR